MRQDYLDNTKFEDLIVVYQKFHNFKKRFEMIMEDYRQVEYRNETKNIIKESVIWEDRIDRYKEKMAGSEKVKEQLCKEFLILAENLTKYARFNLVDFDDAIQEGVLICLERFDRFEPSKGKAFNYMTTCIYNHLRHIYRGHKSHNELKRRFAIFLENSQGSSNIKVYTRNGKERIGRSGHDLFED